MRRYLLSIIFLGCLFSAWAQNNASTDAHAKGKLDMVATKMYEESKLRTVSSFGELSDKILSMTPDQKERLQILLLWFYDNMKADSYRFFQGGNPLPNADAFAERKGLCDEYANMMTEFCQRANIPNYKVTGYVKYPGFKAGEVFTEANHAWNAVHLDTTWVLCDLFWSTTAVTTDLTPRFLKRLDMDYFFAAPSDMINDHLPSDPVFQFSNNPIPITAFTNKISGLDNTVGPIDNFNYNDSLNVLSKMNPNDRLLKIAQHAYAYNKHNPNDLIAEGYNYAADIVNNKASKNLELQKAKTSLLIVLAIIDTSTRDDIKGLKEPCKSGLAIIERKLAGK